MKKRKGLATLIILVLVMSLFAGCGSKDDGAAKKDDGNVEVASDNTAVDSKKIIDNNDPDSQKSDDKTNDTGKKNDSKNTDSSVSNAPKGGVIGASYVMIYNPNIYDEYDSSLSKKSMRNTGKIEDQIVIGEKRADGLDMEIPAMISQNQLVSGSGDTSIQEDGRAGGMDPSYSVGDVHKFYAYDTTAMNTRSQHDFKCIYEGKHCYLWDIDGKVDQTKAEELAKEFDDVIYDKDVKEFGQARFTENGGKVNILFQPMKDELGGFFYLGDIFATGELSPSDSQKLAGNCDHCIININSGMFDNMEFVKSTLAHEFQHQICASASLSKRSGYFIGTWLNESMSAYAEEMIYPGLKKESYFDRIMFFSDNYRKGQSLYNFDTSNDEYIGAYGAVYMLSGYLHDKAGKDVYGNVHSNWRKSLDMDPDEAVLLYDSVSDSFRKEIDEKYSYPSEISGLFKSEQEEWMSKMTLDFYINSLTMDMSGDEDKCHQVMVYSEVSPLDIEGGGRVIVAVDGDSYDVPADADDGLVYVGLDKNFKPTGVPLYK